MSEIAEAMEMLRLFNRLSPRQKSLVLELGRKLQETGTLETTQALLAEYRERLRLLAE